jgi:hypothetical protein
MSMKDAFIAVTICAFEVGIYLRIYIVRRTVTKRSHTWTHCSKGGFEQHKLLVSRQFTKPKSVHATTLENDRCK